VGVVISATDGLTIGAGDKITIPANASINLGGSNGITLGPGTYNSTAKATYIKMAGDEGDIPTLTFESGATFIVGVGTSGVGVLTVGSASAIVKVGTDKIFTENNATAAPGLEVNIAPGANIKASIDNDGGITLATGAIAARNTGIPGVSAAVGLKLLGSDTDSEVAWKVGSPAGVTE
jgi:hypothetical protein